MAITFPRATAYAHQLLTDHLSEGNFALDATCGRGQDTLHLAKLVGVSGRVLAIDRQAEAIDSSKERLLNNGLIESVQFIQANHADLDQHLPQDQTIHAAVFNLGYLPGGDKTIITQPCSTLTAIQCALTHLASNGLIIITVYPGHQGGMDEANAVDAFVRTLSQCQFEVMHYGFLNQVNHPPSVYAIRSLSVSPKSISQGS